MCTLPYPYLVKVESLVDALNIEIQEIAVPILELLLSFFVSPCDIGPSTFILVLQLLMEAQKSHDLLISKKA